MRAAPELPSMSAQIGHCSSEELLTDDDDGRIILDDDDGRIILELASRKQCSRLESCAKGANGVALKGSQKGPQREEA